MMVRAGRAAYLAQSRRIGELLEHVQACEVRVGARVGLHAGRAERGHDVLSRCCHLQTGESYLSGVTPPRGVHDMW